MGIPKVATSLRSEVESKLQGLRRDFDGQLESRVSTLRELCGSSRSIEDFASRLASQVSQLEALEKKLGSELRTVRSACRDEMKSQLEDAKTSLSEEPWVPKEIAVLVSRIDPWKKFSRPEA